MEWEHAKFDPKCYRLDKQIRSLILVCEPQWTEKSLALNVNLAEVEINADERLAQPGMGVNLIHNSIKFTPNTGQVDIDLRQQGPDVLFEIRDTGIGISEGDLPRVFERFYKADKSRTKSPGGSGLGLAIVKKIVEMHLGKIDVQSAPGSGTTFRVRLPASRPPLI